MPRPPFRETPEGMNRRAFVSWVAIGWAGFAGAMGGSLTAIGRLFFPNVTFEPPQEFTAGFPGEYAADKVDERFKKKFGVWIVRDSHGLYVLSTVCTHLGCTPNWLEAERKFKCPCHGSGYYITGVNFEGPAPRPLERFAVSLAEDGQIFVNKNLKFQEEKGQWSDARAYLPLS